MGIIVKLGRALQIYAKRKVMLDDGGDSPLKFPPGLKAYAIYRKCVKLMSTYQCLSVGKAQKFGKYYAVKHVGEG